VVFFLWVWRFRLGKWKLVKACCDDDKPEPCHAVKTEFKTAFDQTEIFPKNALR